ncbi:MAG: TonB-dependent receptor, partial [Acidobacteria bacterium]|nr:TonB-dependent receptor [Acidobacteriota bacterium]
RGGEESVRDPVESPAPDSLEEEGTTSLIVALPGADLHQYRRQTLFGFYVQDNYRVNSSLQLNLGLRYEFAPRVRELLGRFPFLSDPTRDSVTQTGPFFTKDNPSLLNFAPRLGIRWSPWNDQGPVLSAGFGIYYDQLLASTVPNRRAVSPFLRLVVRTNFDSSATFPDAIAAAVGQPFQQHILDYENFANPMMLRYHFSVQQQLLGGWQVQASYVGARNNHLYRGYEANRFPLPVTRPDGSLFFPPRHSQINPAFDSINIVTSDAQSFYNALQVSMNKAFDQGIFLQANYTYSKSVDDASRVSGIFHPDSSSQYGLMRTLDRGLSDFDIRHRLAINYFYTFPFGKTQRWWNSGFLAHLFGDWRLGGILTFRSGIPITPQVNIRTPGYLFVPSRPSLIPSQSNNPVKGFTAGCVGVKDGQELGTRDLYFDPCVFDVPSEGTLGTAGRNTIIAPNVFNFDVSLQKDFLLDSKRRLQFRAEFFNLLNHTNFGENRGGSVIIFSGSPARRNATAGRIGSTATTARQIQFALRFSF